jgi:sulfite reductase alpha subunit-like flavoprotein
MLGLRKQVSSVASTGTQQGRLLRALFSSSSVPAASGKLPNSWQVVYASQTGNAQAFGLQLADNLGSMSSGVTDVYELDPKELLDCSAHNENENGIVFIFSTFGKGEPTDSAKKFMAWLTDPSRDAENAALIAKGQKPLLGHLRFSCFGLGNNNTHAAHYNAAAKKLDARLEQLGGQRVFPLGLGDDSKQLELDFEQYQNALIDEIKKNSGGSPSASPAATPTTAAAPTPAAPTAAATTATAPPLGGGSNASLAALAAAAAAALRANNPSNTTAASLIPPAAAIAATVPKPVLFSPPASTVGPTCSTVGAPQSPIRVVPDSGSACDPYLPPLSVAQSDGKEMKRKMQSVLISGLTNLSPLGSTEFKPIWEMGLSSNLPYTTGDHVAVAPRAPSAVALALCERCAWDPSTAFTLEAAKPGARLPIVGATTVRNALTRHVDVGAAITPQMLRVLSVHASDETERQALQTLASDSALYTSLIRQRFIRLLDLLYAFPSVTLPFDKLLATWPAMIPRYYSISSSSSACSPFTSAGASPDATAGPAAAAATPNRMLVSFKQLRWALAPLVSTNATALGNKIEEGAVKAASSVQRHDYHNRIAAAAPKGFRIFEGLNSTYMAGRRIGDSLDISVRSSNFRLPEDPSVPIVMIAGGIGVTPFRAFLEERMWQALQAMATGRGATFRYGPATLLFGCRNGEKLL